MIVFRISNPLYSDDISGIGAKLFGSRWNSKGLPMLYTSEHISLALLEMLVHSGFNDYAIDLDLVHIQFPDNSSIQDINISKLKKNWNEHVDYTRFIGDEFIKSTESLILKVPSVVVSQEYNYLINPLHTDFKKIKIIKTKSFSPDKRLFLL